MAVAGPFDRPIPGQSLTTEPRNNPWEQPPEMADVEDVAKFYVERLANQDVLDDLAAMVQLDVPLAPIVESVYMMGVMRGLHTIDSGMLVAPMIHNLLKAVFTDMGIKVKDSPEDPQERAEKAEMNRFMALATKYLEDEGMDESDEGKTMLSDMVEAAEDEPEEEAPAEEMQEAKPMGLMAKG